jgi:hypothetical protein
VPPESDDNLHLEIGHVLFIDIVGYSKLLIEEQKERLNQLTEIVLATKQAGFIEHLTKPVEWDRLQNAVERLLSRRRSLEP